MIFGTGSSPTTTCLHPTNTQISRNVISEQDVDTLSVLPFASIKKIGRCNRHECAVIGGRWGSASPDLDCTTLQQILSSGEASHCFSGLQKALRCLQKALEMYFWFFRKSGPYWGLLGASKGLPRTSHTLPCWPSENLQMWREVTSLPDYRTPWRQ